MEFKQDIGELTEDEVQQVVEHAFSPFFVFRAPRKEADQKEVTDVLATWDDTALIIQVKAQAVGEGRGSRGSLKWAEKNLKKAGKQVAGAVRAIREGRMTHMENPLRGRVPFPGDEIKWLYGIVILHHSSPPYDPFQLVPKLQDTKVPLHVLSLRDLSNLARFLDTPADLVNYLEERSSVLVPNLNPRVHEEEGVFSLWLSNLEKIMAFRAEKMGKNLTEEDVRPYAESMRRLLSGEMPEAGAGMIIDQMIELAHEQDTSLAPISWGDEIIEMEPAASVKVATELSKIPRARRIALGRRYLRTLQDAAEAQHDAWKSTHSQKRSDCMLFLASPRPIEQRQERMEHLHWMTHLLMHRHQVKKGIGVATEAGEDAGRSYDFVFLEGEPTENEELTQLAVDLFGKSKGLLVDEPEDSGPALPVKAPSVDSDRETPGS